MLNVVLDVPHFCSKHATQKHPQKHRQVHQSGSSSRLFVTSSAQRVVTLRHRGTAKYFTDKNHMRHPTHTLFAPTKKDPEGPLFDAATH
jgi:hypothetical protein